jgi:hypothetical protein
MNAPVVTMTSCTSGGITSITVTPTMAEKGSHTVVFYVTDGMFYTPFILTINAVDSPPFFKTTFQATYDSFINTITSYTLPDIDEYQS